MFRKLRIIKRKKIEVKDSPKKITVGDIAIPKVHKEIRRWAKYFEVDRY